MPRPETPKAWMPREQWDALVRGENCPLCAELRSTEPANAYGRTIADLRMGRLRLASNQFPAGYCVLICARHVREPYHLSPEERQLFFDDMMVTGRVLERVFNADKMNFMLLGNAVPHLHAHIQPRYYGDPCPGRPVGVGDPVVNLTPPEYEERARLIRHALAEILGQA